jgi:uncharacterized protein YcnI
VIVDREVTTARTRRTAPRLVVAALLPLVVVGLAAPASAHVTITPSTTTAGANAVLDVSVPHGCDGSSTTEVTIQIPDEVIAVSPTRDARWQQVLETVPLDPPTTDSRGNQVTERTAAVTYRVDTPLPDADRDVFELALRLPDGAGRTLVFPTIQRCEQGEAAWIEVAEEGQDPEQLALPAPAFVVTADSRPTSATSILAAGPSSAARPEPTVQVPVVAYAALGLGVLVVMLGVAWLARLRRRT